MIGCGVVWCGVVWLAEVVTSSAYHRVWLSPVASLFGEWVATSSTSVITVYYNVLYNISGVTKYSTVLYYTILYYAILSNIILWKHILYYELCCAVLHHHTTTPHHVTLHSIIVIY